MHYVSQISTHGRIQPQAQTKALNAAKSTSAQITNLSLALVVTGVFGLTIATILQRLVGLI